MQIWVCKSHPSSLRIHSAELPACNPSAGAHVCNSHTLYRKRTTTDRAVHLFLLVATGKQSCCVLRASEDWCERETGRRAHMGCAGQNLRVPHVLRLFSQATSQFQLALSLQETTAKKEWEGALGEEMN